MEVDEGDCPCESCCSVVGSIFGLCSIVIVSRDRSGLVIRLPTTEDIGESMYAVVDEVAVDPVEVVDERLCASSRRLKREFLLSWIDLVCLLRRSIRPKNLPQPGTLHWYSFLSRCTDLR